MRILSCLLGLIMFLASVTCLYAGGAGPGVSADQALTLLQNGNAMYVAGKTDHPNQGFARRDETAKKGQHPFVTILSCSDSRVPVEIIFDKGVGDIFVVRVAGNVTGTDETATIEYGVDHLGTPLLVVLGHTKCGAVTAVCQNAEVHGNIPALVKLIEPAVAEAKKNNPKASGDDLINAAIEANIWKAIENLYKTSPMVAGLSKDGKVKVIGAMYQIDTGKVNWLGSHPKDKELVAAAASSKKAAH